MCPHQLPVEGPPGVGVLLTQQSAVVLGFSTDTDGLNHLGEVDKVHELHCLVGAGVCGVWGVYMCGMWGCTCVGCGGVHVWGVGVYMCGVWGCTCVGCVGAHTGRRVCVE